MLQTTSRPVLTDYSNHVAQPLAQSTAVPAMRDRAKEFLDRAPQIIADQVSVWIDRAKTQKLPHGIVFKHCEQLSEEHNWEMLTLALNLMSDKLPQLAENIRLLWIIQDNLEALIKPRVEGERKHEPRLANYFGKSVDRFICNPPLEVAEQLIQIKTAIEEVKDPSANLKLIQDNLPIWTKFIDLMGSLIPSTLTCRKAPLFPAWQQIPLPEFISYLWKNKMAFGIKLEGLTYVFWPLSPYDCRVDVNGQNFALLKTALPQHHIEFSAEFSELPQAVQEEFNSSKAQLLQFGCREAFRSLEKDKNTSEFSKTADALFALPDKQNAVVNFFNEKLERLPIEKKAEFLRQFKAISESPQINLEALGELFMRSFPTSVAEEFRGRYIPDTK